MAKTKSAPTSSQSTQLPAPVPPTVPTAPLRPRDDAIIVGRDRQRRVDITLVHGSILDVTTRAIVLGSFRNVDPGGAAKAVDARLGGALQDLIRSRSVSSETGSMFVLPTSRSGLQTDMVIFAGLGPFDQFNVSLIQLVASNLVRTLVRGNVEEFATVLFGAGSGFDAKQCVQHLLRGVLGSLRDSDVEHRFRGLTICETDDAKFEWIRDEVYRGFRDDFYQDFDVVVRERRLPRQEPARPPEGAARTAVPPQIDPLYLIVRSDRPVRGNIAVEASVLTAGGKAVVLQGKCRVKKAALDAALAAIEAEGFGEAAVAKLGRTLAEIVLPKDVRDELAKAQWRHIAVVHDLDSARLPWETLRLGEWVPALTAGMSRRYLASDLAVGRWAEHRERQEDLSLLLIVDPTSDLAGAVKEAERIGQLAAKNARVRITRLEKGDATRDRVLDSFRSERYDAIHYAGHASFDEHDPGQSGILCADGPLRAIDLLNLRSLPPLLFFNACEAGRLRGAKSGAVRRDARKTLNKIVGFAEAFMRYGVMNYVGTYWPVGDTAASVFAQAFYGALLSGDSVSNALLIARKAVRASGSIDWADYIHYGDPRFRLKSAAPA